MKSNEIKPGMKQWKLLSHKDKLEKTGAAYFMFVLEKKIIFIFLCFLLTFSLFGGLLK